MGKDSRDSSVSRRKKKTKKERNSSREKDAGKRKDAKKKQAASRDSSSDSSSSSSSSTSSASSRSGLSSSARSRSSRSKRKDKKKTERRSSKDKKGKDVKKKDKKKHKDRDRSKIKKKSSKDDKKKDKKRSRSRDRHPRSRERDLRDRSRDRRDKDRSKTRRSRDKHDTWRNRRSGSRKSSRGRPNSRERRSRDRRRYDNGPNSRRNDKSQIQDKGKSSSAFKFDSPPREMKIIEEKTKDMMSNIELLSEMIGNLSDFSHSEICQQLQILQEVQAVQSANIDRKLYIGNIAKNITTSELTEMLNRALEKLGTSQEGGEPLIISSWIAPNCQYAICEFRSPSDADAGMALNNILLFGKPLRVGRFRISEGITSGKGSGNLMSLLGITGVGADHTLLNKPFRIYLPSKILVLLFVVTKDQLIVQEEFEEIYEDIKETLSKYGKVVKLEIPQPKSDESECPGMGHAFVEYSAVSSAQLARREVSKKLYNGRRIEACYYDEGKFAKQNYDLKFTYIK